MFSAATAAAAAAGIATGITNATDDAATATDDATEDIVVANSAASSPFAALVFDGLLTITDVDSVHL